MRHMSETHSQGFFIRGPFSYTHGTFGAFICRDGSVLGIAGMVVSRCCACQCQCEAQLGGNLHKNTLLDSEARHSMARGLKNTTASADSACRWGTYTVMHLFFTGPPKALLETPQRSDPIRRVFSSSGILLRRAVLRTPGY